ncbi:MAG: TlpA family protein disulfide reductase [Armatimonadetes bacterium]|nr:TlpA family protein disulfide reductase [Armatimonadota bacterium]
MRSEGLNVIGISTQDTMEEISDFRKEFKLTMPLVVGGTGDDSVPRKYGIVAAPTNYVLDKDGKVVAHIIGGDMEAIRAALAELGVQKK